MFKNQKGISLVEIMVAGTIMVGIGLVMTKMTVNTNKGIKVSEKNLEMISLMNEIQSVLKSPLACLNSFSGLNAKSQSGITLIKNSKNVIRYRAAQTYGSSGLILSSISLDDSSDKVEVVTSDAGTTYLELVFDRGDKSAATRYITKTLRLSVTTDASDNILACNTSGEAIAQEIWVNTDISNNGYNIVNGENITLKVDGGAYGLTLPDSPNHGDIIRFVHGDGVISANNVTLTPGAGDTIIGDTDLILDIDNISIDLFFYDTNGDNNGDWRLL